MVDINKILEKFLSDLEKEVLELELRKENINTENSNHNKVTNLISKLQKSKLDVCKDYNDDYTKEIVDIIKLVVKDNTKLNLYLSELTNYFILYQTGLLYDISTSFQKEHSESVLDELEQDLTLYQSSINKAENNKKIKEIDEDIQNIISLGTKLEYFDENVEIDNIDLLEYLLSISSLEEDEKLELLNTILLQNVSFYQNDLSKTKEREDIELESFDELETTSVIKKISPEELESIERLLNNPKVQERIIRVVNGNKDIPEDEMETAYELVKEEITDLVQEELVDSYEEALNVFFEENDEELNNAKILAEDLFDEEEIDLDSIELEESLELIEKATLFYEKHKKLLKELTSVEKESIDNYMKGLYKNKENREVVYKQKQYSKDYAIEIEATYEIEVLLNIVDKLKIGDSLNQETIKKVGNRIKEIFETLDNVNEKENINPKSEEEKSTVIFLDKINNKTYFEDDIKVDSSNKGISSSFYPEIIEGLEKLDNRGTNKIKNATTRNKYYQYLKEYGVKVVEGLKTRIYYIPVGNNNSIVVGVDTKGSIEYTDLLETRIKNNQNQIDLLISNIISNTNINKDRIETIKEQLSKKKKEELDDMFIEEQEEITKKTK